MRPVTSGISLAIALLLTSSSVMQEAHLYMPGIGPVKVQASLPPNGFPTITFSDAKGTSLLQTRIGTDDPVIFKMVPDENTDGSENPIVRFKVILQPDKTPAVLAVARYAGGSDCGYEANIIAVHNGHLQPWFDVLPGNSAEGGLYVGELGNGNGYGAAAWNFIWAGGEYHSGPHRYRVKLYRYNAETGKMVLFSNRITFRTHDSPKTALAEFGLKYPNVESTFADFGC